MDQMARDMGEIIGKPKAAWSASNGHAALVAVKPSLADVELGEDGVMEDVVDLIADLLHLAEREGVDVDRVMDAAWDHYRSETD